jgi:hypothetical protein
VLAAIPLRVPTMASSSLFSLMSCGSYFLVRRRRVVGLGGSARLTRKWSTSVRWQGLIRKRSRICVPHYPNANCGKLVSWPKPYHYASLPMSERFELVGEHGDTSGHLRLAYGTGPDDTMLFVLTLTPGYVARVMENMPPGTQVVTRYAYDNAGDLRAMALREKESGRLILILE